MLTVKVAKSRGKGCAPRGRPPRRQPRLRSTRPASALRYPPFKSSIGLEMLLVPSGTFQMGSEAADAAPNEAPVSSVTLTRFYLSRHPITNAQYEMFDPSHARKRAPGAGDHHPVVYVSNARGR